MTAHPNGTTPNSHVRRVCAALTDHPGATARDLAALTGIDLPAVARALTYARTAGLVDSDQHGRQHRNWLARTPAPPPPNAADQVLEAIRSGCSTRAAVRTRLRMPNATVQRALVELAADGRIVISQERPAYRFVVSTLSTGVSHA